VVLGLANELMRSLADIIDSSGDSLLETYAYANGFLTVKLTLGETEQKVELAMPTEHLSFDACCLAKKEDLYRTCRIVIQDLSQVISVANGVYVPAPDFGKLMQQAKANYNLAYGKKASHWKYLFSLIGYGHLVSCLLADLEAVSIVELAE
jgi:hypothetical protein